MAERSRLDQQGQGSDTDASILSNNFGGINTTASLLNIPYTDSPSLLNVDVDIAGNVGKRKGTVLTGAIPSASPIYTHPVTTSLGYNFVLAKQLTSIFVYQFIDDAISTVFSLNNVFSSRASTTKPYFLLLPELEPRLLLLTATNAPVHVKFVEQSLSVTSASPTTTITVPNAQRFANIATTSTRVFVNRVFQPSATFSYSGGTLTINNVTSFSGTVTVDVIGTVWQWWAESLRWLGDRFYDTKSRFNVTKSDQNLEIPKGLRSDIELINQVYGDYPIYLYSTSVNNSIYTRVNQPDTSSKYGFGNGSIYNYTVNDFLQPTPFFATFGDIRTGCTPSPCVAEPTYMLRRRETRFNNDTTIAANNLMVNIDGVQATANYSATPTGTRQYQTFDSTGTLNTSSSAAIRYIAFSGSTPIGVSATSVIRMINTGGVNTIVGSGASSSLDSYTNGSIFPVYGLGLFADYLNGSFPSVGAIFQGRLVLSGMRHDPSRVIFSAVNDVIEPGVRYNFFQITDDLSGLDTDPFDMVVASNNADDYVNGLVEWQNSLFILTRRSVFRASGGSSNTLAPTRRFLNFVSSLGLVNAWSVVRTDVAVYYLSDFGVFNLIPRVEDGEYIADEKSLKIRKMFTGGSTALAWMAFDTVKKVLYVALPTSSDTANASQMLVYNTFRDSWTKYDTVNRFRTFTGHQYVDRQTNEQFMMVVTLPNGNTGFIRMNGDRYADFTTKGFFSGSVNVGFTVFFFDYTPIPTVRDYNMPQDFVMPQDNIEDLVVFYDNRRLEFGVDYVKTSKGFYLNFSPESGKPMRAYSRRPVTDGEIGLINAGVTSKVDSDPFVVWVNNKLLIEGSDYTLSKTATTVQANLSLDVASNSQIEVGYTYLSYYTTPMFVNERLGNLKRTKHLYLFMDNEVGLDVYDTNGRLGDATFDEIVGVPKTRMNASIAIMYDNERTGESSYDIYGYQELIWDFTFFDTNQSNLQNNRYILLKETLKGVGYSHQVMVWSYDEAAWRLSGYQIDFNQKGTRYK